MYLCLELGFDQGATLSNLSFWTTQGYFEVLGYSSEEFRRNKNEWIDCKNKYGHTPLFVSAAKGHYLVVELFIELGARLDTMDNLGCTALHAAVSRRQDAIAFMLINHGASPFVENMQGVTAMDIVCKHGLNVMLLRHIESRAIFCGWVEQKVSRFGIGYDWSRRWVVVAQRLRYHGNGRLHEQPQVKTVLLSYQGVESMVAACKCWLDASHALKVPSSQRLISRNAKMEHTTTICLGRGHPSVRGAFTSKSQGRFILHFRPVGVDDSSLAILSTFISYINWASQLGSTEPVVGPTAPSREESPHWALEPPQLLQTNELQIDPSPSSQTQHEVDFDADIEVSDTVDSSHRAGSSQDREMGTGSCQGGDRECLICMDNRIEVVFCHRNQTYVSSI